MANEPSKPASPSSAAPDVLPSGPSRWVRLMKLCGHHAYSAGGVRWRTAERRAERGLQGGAPHGAHLRGNLHEREPELELAGAVGAVLARVLWDMDLVMDGRTEPSR